jgi:hypothetical protein
MMPFEGAFGMKKQILGLIGTGVALLIIYFTKSAFGMSDQTFMWVALAVVVLGMGFHFSKRLNALEERVLHKDYDAIKKEIEEGERHVPQHKQPKALAENGVKSYVNKADEIVFEDFKWFGSMLNREIADAWAVEEMEDTEQRELGAEAPEYGRRYQIYYNSRKMGTLQVRAGGFDVLNEQRFSANRRVVALIDLSDLRFVEWDDALSLVRTVVFCLGPFKDRQSAWERATAEATTVLTGHAWDATRVPNHVLDFHHRTDGPYDLVRQTTEHWKKHEIDPFEKWGGDRPRARAS